MRSWARVKEYIEFRREHNEYIAATFQTANVGDARFTAVDISRTLNMRPSPIFVLAGARRLIQIYYSVSRRATVLPCLPLNRGIREGAHARVRERAYKRVGGRTTGEFEKFTGFVLECVK